MTGPDAPEPRRPRHLIDPNNPRKPPTREDQERLRRVQRWVLSILVATTILHLAAALVVYAVTVLDDDQLTAIIGLNALAGAFGVVALSAGFAIHQRSVLTPWVLLGLLPGLFGLYWTLLR